jgi:DNA-binding response OmpR family regulator
MSWAKIVVIDDEPEIVELIQQVLESDGFTVLSASAGKAGLELVAREVPDLVLLDVGLPDLSGFDICRELRRDPRLSGIPIIIISGRRGESNVVLGLGLGADDYVVKPFSSAELLARVRAVIRRAQRDGGSTSARICCDGLVVDTERHEVHVEGEAVELTPTEFRLLHALATHRGQVLSRRQLVRTAIAQQVVERTIDVHIRAIRRKLRSCSDLIETVRGIGYRLRG